MLDAISLDKNPPTTSYGSNGQSGTKISEEYGNFLKLFTTQLQNQDPTAPTDTNEMSAQIAQFTQVEQSVQTNDKIGQLVDISKGSQNALLASTQLSVAVSYIGKEVKVAGSEVQVDDSQNPIEIGYVLEKGTRGSSIEITDKNGQIVYRGNGKSFEGEHNFSWNGKDNDGRRVDPGTYKVKVKAEGADASSKDAVTLIRGVVTASDFENGSVTLLINDKIKAPLEKVFAIYNPKTTTN